MIKLKYDQVELIRPLLAERIRNNNIGDRCPLEYAFSLVTLNAIGDRVHIYVDKIPNPAALLVLSHVRASVCNEVAVIMNMIYISEEVRRDDPRLAITLKDEMFDTAEAFAKAKDADVLQAGSWVYRGCPDISPILKQKGFEPQTREFVKILKNNP